MEFLKLEQILFSTEKKKWEKIRKKKLSIDITLITIRNDSECVFGWLGGMACQ